MSFRCSPCRLAGILLAALFVPGLAAAAGSCERLVATGNPEYPPYLWRDPQDPKRLIGANADLLQRLGKELGVRIDVLYSGSWEKAQEEVTSGRADLLAGLREQGFPVLDLTDNEMAKLHIRHMVGGHGTEVRRERLFRFEFPERPGALLNFLDKLGSRWNISLFHYRNHGAADGRVLAGLQVPDEERGELEAALQAIGYPYWEETHNPAYRLFAG